MSSKASSSLTAMATWYSCCTSHHLTPPDSVRAPQGYLLPVDNESRYEEADRRGCFAFVEAAEIGVTREQTGATTTLTAPAAPAVCVMLSLCWVM
ncbi:hypothetical protein EYF80_037495 [Liparis tanakae]|uniref:Uncharacterized protein n=1 Tax=Liparis tanakae TaxID=230148 RepID=A0A4Z2GFF7_9TELE|nr:hypothetical protein EYF80_037495 [Liparis tanakae]